MRPTRILLIEDNPITSKIVQITLESEGYSVLEASSGRSAIELMSRTAPDLVLQDLILPDLDGVDLMRKLRDLPGGEHVPILAFSGFYSTLEELKDNDAGFTDYVAKPIEPSVLLKTVGSYVRPTQGCSQGQPGSCTTME
ncbi:MAG: response regulator [Bryobacteraceae bacterium]